MARSQQELDWQSTKKTVLERSCHMFNNPFMSDIAFSCEGSDKKFFAHKYVLATSSAVFHAMFYGELAEKNSVVHLSDTDEESLEEFLRFLYTDECNLTTHNAVVVLYLAKKYIVPALAQKCFEYFDANFAAENVFILLQQAIQFDENKLEEKCWDLIDLKTSEAVASDGFYDINQATLVELVKREPLNVEEVDLFKAVLKWSEAECSRKGIEANAKNKRAAMGNAIYQIRFASMTLQDLAQNASRSDILTPEEMLLFYDKLGKVKRTSEVWNMSETRAKEDILLRCRIFNSYRDFLIRLTVSTWVDALGISFSKPVKLHGVRLLGCKEKEYNVKLEVSSRIIEKKFLPKQDNRGISGFDVMLPVPIKVQANVPVHLKATITGCHYCSAVWDLRVKKIVEINGITINFETEEGGHFDGIIFSENLNEMRHSYDFRDNR
ncbi:BTB POZ domain-containing 6 isoform X2 [Paramuricea clavata]|uniref:BTB POZ domain-containing 6 isoform X2 n=1 Tax=Paramuricea clavata TaxID=317549 RepID=A0A7D9M7I9_PARCT|nr:BTB POZ domain-containing 6 isoform X2 [Paramuricea clavata]